MSALLAGNLAWDGELRPGWVEVQAETVLDARPGPPPRTPDEDWKGVIAPGLVDLQVNGGAGHEVTEGHAALDAIDEIQLAHGVTRYLATVVDPADAGAEATVTAISERARDPSSPVAGAHLEGPFLSPEHAGMHRAASLRTPSEGVPDCYWVPGVRLVTIAPELPGALELIGRLRAQGITVALGHSGASATVARAGVDAGATLITHVFNAMAPLQHRAPGLAGVALTDARVRVGVIADAHHIDPIVLEIVRRCAGDRTVLVSDASPGAQAPPGRYEFGGVSISRGADGVVRTASGQLAGSTLTLDEAVRTWTSSTGATLGEALGAATQAPARTIRTQAGLTPGQDADLVLFDSDGFARRVMYRGRWLS